MARKSRASNVAQLVVPTEAQKRLERVKVLQDGIRFSRREAFDLSDSTEHRAEELDKIVLRLSEVVTLLDRVHLSAERAVRNEEWERKNLELDLEDGDDHYKDGD